MLDAKATGERFEWSFNFQYMLDAIDSYRKSAERIVIDTNGPENPAVIRPEISAAGKRRRLRFHDPHHADGQVAPSRWRHALGRAWRLW